MTPPKLHTAHETAPLIRKSASWLYRQARVRAIPHTRIGSNVFWTDEQIERIIREGVVEPRAAQSKRAIKKQSALASPQPTFLARPKVAPTNRTPVPKADRSVSRLYRATGAP
ncbi:hypothetical protein ACIBCT_38850 [Streptosporangium sp. NPDC050855]|uniref:hypothetical protein n=1 Tax=Streptosporangium sp. NPDC050855 TaxID=3366194 RepID=UPI0037BB33F0